MRRHINAQKGREKLNHAVKTINKISMLFGKVNMEGEFIPDKRKSFKKNRNRPLNLQLLIIFSKYY